MLHCEFPLGRPLGLPNEPDFQHRVLRAAFDLLTSTDVPVLVDFPDTIVDEADAPLTCPLPPRLDPNLHPAVDEAIGLLPAYQRQRRRSGRTNVVRAGGPDRIPALVTAFTHLAAGEEWAVAGAPIDVGGAALDVRAYYEEAALGLADHVPAARQAESWFYRHTVTGDLLRRTQQHLRASGASRAIWFALAPSGQELRTE
ncbi:MAG: hypothetical protein ABIQ73_19900 [Acidimicrobiales bacterium]